ncbi:MAG: universal stress protein [Candidatus Hodarchaeales archaeon]|jgi:nucleotide-binding universal stress UspA family protein
MPLDPSSSKEWGCITERILLPLRGFPAEQYAAHFALYQAEASGAQVDIFHVEKHVPTPQFDFEKVLNPILETAETLGVATSLKTVQGQSAREEIAKQLQKEPYDMIIMGSRRHRGLLPDFRTSNAVSVAKMEERPCLVVVETIRDPFDEYRPWTQRRIMVSLNKCDFIDDISIRLASAMTSSSSTPDASIHGVRVVIVPDIVPLRAAKDFIREVEEDFLRCIGNYRQLLGRNIEPEIVFGHSEARALGYLATKREADLICYGVRGSYSLAGKKIASIWALNERSPPDCHVAYIFE